MKEETIKQIGTKTLRVAIQFQKNKKNDRACSEENNSVAA